MWNPMKRQKERWIYLPSLKVLQMLMESTNSLNTSYCFSNKLKYRYVFTWFKIIMLLEAVLKFCLFNWCIISVLVKQIHFTFRLIGDKRDKP